MTSHQKQKVKVQIEWQNQLITYDPTKMYGISNRPQVRFPTFSSNIDEYTKFLYLLNSMKTNYFPNATCEVCFKPSRYDTGKFRMRYYYIISYVTVIGALNVSHSKWY